MKNRTAGIVIEEGLDADRFPTLKCSIGAKAIFIRLSTDYERSDEDGHVDALGLAQRVYSPHKCELLGEDAATTVVDPTTYDMRAQALAECSKLGMKLIVREGEGVQDAADWAAADTAAATTVSTIKSHDIHPLTQQM